MKAKILALLCSVVVLAGCEQVDKVKAMFTPVPKCHDVATQQAVVSIAGEKVLEALNGRESSLEGVVDVLHPRSYVFENVLDVSAKDDTGRICKARMTLVPPPGYEIDAAILSGLSFGSVLQNEVLGIQGLRQQRPTVLDFPPDIKPGKSISWDIDYQIRLMSDGSDSVVTVFDAESIAQFLTYYIIQNQPN